ncbi:YdeI/OmpD-associated family protein [Neolewinella persica]|uniref:YdeI/OmpD-associated family protein n=1 Tax=Neolewinella persica TaxID=70998 RepID=UPI000381B0AC|nr:YdeI/OmpD-associated family protein [Neolewinella persica]
METSRPDGFPAFYASSAEAWRTYLTVNHEKLVNTWLIIFKKDSGTPSLTYEEARDEALCFGWIDSKPNKRDDDSYYLFFAKRSPKSNWSRVNKDRIAELDAAGKLAPAGILMVEDAKARGTWDALNDVENLVVPDDLEVEFDRVAGAARKHWDNFPPSTRRGILEWIFNGKRAETRAKRIAETVDMASRNERANQYRK